MSDREQLVADHVAAFGKPDVVSLDEETHIFHFHREGWIHADILFVNRNGNHFRLIKQNGHWEFIKTWNGLFKYDDWMAQAHLSRTDAKTLIYLCGVGPQGKQNFEALSLLPREATGTERGRKAVWRAHMLDVRFYRDSDGFSLSHRNGGDVMVSPIFTGKPWESHAAADWCKSKLIFGYTGHADVKRETLAQAKMIESIGDLQDNALWGMF